MATCFRRFASPTLMLHGSLLSGAGPGALQRRPAFYVVVQVQPSPYVVWKGEV